MYLRRRCSTDSSIGSTARENNFERGGGISCRGILDNWAYDPCPPTSYFWLSLRYAQGSHSVCGSGRVLFIKHFLASKIAGSTQESSPLWGNRWTSKWRWPSKVGRLLLALT